MKLNRYSIGVGDRFAHQGEAQLRAIMKANKRGLNISPVWNKSHREHLYVYSHPDDVKLEADNAVKILGFEEQYFIDADHINFDTVEPFVHSSNFFTLDVATYINKPSSQKEIDVFLSSCHKYIGLFTIPGVEDPFEINRDLLLKIAEKFLNATNKAAQIYYYLKDVKGAGSFITEISMDEVERPQTPIELLFILKMLADSGIPVQTIAPKFIGRFNKGVDYVGDLALFAKEFEQYILVIDYAIKEFGLPQELKLSVHSGSDKFSIYPVIKRILTKHQRGLHLKTAGTTWLEEVIGLAKAGGDGLEMAKKIYSTSIARIDELCIPYADVIDIDRKMLPSIKEVKEWGSDKFVNTLQHVPNHPTYNPHFRQLMHVAYTVAAEMKQEFTLLLKTHREIIAECVEENIYERHLKGLFLME